MYLNLDYCICAKYKKLYNHDSSFTLQYVRTNIYNMNKQHQTCAAFGANFKFRFIFRIFIALSNPQLMVLSM